MVDGTEQAETTVETPLTGAGLGDGIDGFNLFAPPPPKPKKEPRKPRGPVPMGYGQERKIRGKRKPPESLFTLDWAFRDIGGREGAIGLARLLAAKEPRLKALVQAWGKQLPSARKYSPHLLEKLAVECELDPAEFLGLCAQAMHKYQFDAARLLVNRRFEEIAEAGAEQAAQPEGFNDRKLIYEHMRFLPEKGPGVAIQVNSQGGGQTLPDFKNLAEIALQATRRELAASSEEQTIDGQCFESLEDSESEPTEGAPEDLLG